MSKYIYQNSRGDTIDLCNRPMWVASFNPLRSYGYERIENNGVFYGHRRKQNVIKPLVFQYYAAGRQAFLDFRENFYKIINYDLVVDQYGKLWDGEWSGVGNFPQETVDTYDKVRGLWTSTIDFFMPEEVWMREVNAFEFFGNQEPEVVPAIPLANYPLNYPHGYINGDYANRLVNDSEFPSPFKMVIYGQCNNPYVTIGGHVYNVNVSVPTGSRLVIDSYARTIVVQDSHNVATNVFASQNHDSDKYIFEPVKSGEFTVIYENIPKMVLILYEERNAAKWT